MSESCSNPLLNTLKPVLDVGETSLHRLAPRWQLVGLIVVLILHIATFYMLLQLKPAYQSMQTTPAPIMVSLFTPPRIEEPPPPPRVKPPSQKQIPKAAPVPAVTPVPPPAVLTTTAPQSVAPFVASVVTPTPVPTPPLVEPSPVVPPSFDAAYLHNPQPAYPVLSQRNGEQGMVMLRVYVGASGTAEKVEIKTSSGWSRLDHAASDTVLRLWRFLPARQGDTAVAAWVLVPIQFTVED